MDQDIPGFVARHNGTPYRKGLKGDFPYEFDAYGCARARQPPRSDAAHIDLSSTPSFRLCVIVLAALPLLSEEQLVIIGRL
ncbi:hypothetical protein K1719_040784 [Acacia pycnantha]|nr:hypothetical protein K1719_040784 [Acacia pycnantha]